MARKLRLSPGVAYTLSDLDYVAGYKDGGGMEQGIFYARERHDGRNSEVLGMLWKLSHSSMRELPRESWGATRTTGRYVNTLDPRARQVMLADDNKRSRSILAAELQDGATPVFKLLFHQTAEEDGWTLLGRLHTMEEASTGSWVFSLIDEAEPPAPALAGAPTFDADGAHLVLRTEAESLAEDVIYDPIHEYWVKYRLRFGMVPGPWSTPERLAPPNHGGTMTHTVPLLGQGTGVEWRVWARNGESQSAEVPASTAGSALAYWAWVWRLLGPLILIPVLLTMLLGLFSSEIDALINL